MSTTTLTLARNTYPVTLPSIRDSRLHVASVAMIIMGKKPGQASVEAIAELHG